MRDKFANLRDAAICLLAFSSYICAYSSLRKPRSLPCFKMWATGAACRVPQQMGSVTSRVNFFQNVVRNGFRKRRCEKYFGGGTGAFHVAMDLHAFSKPEVNSAVPCGFLAGHAPRPSASLLGFLGREAGAVVYGSKRCSARRLQVQRHRTAVGSPTCSTAAAGGDITDAANRTNASSVVGNAFDCLNGTECGLNCSAVSRVESGIVELAGEVVPSRVKGPISRYSVCLLHGLLGSRRNMRTLGSFLASPFILAWDLRNHGQSAWRETMSIDDLARDVLYNLHERASLFSNKSLSEPRLDLRDNGQSENYVLPPNEPPLQVVLVGHSLGGLTAMRAALLGAGRQTSQGHNSTPRPPVRIAGIVILDVAPIDYTTTLEQERFRAHREKTGIPGTEDIVRLLNDMPMHLFENRRQLEQTLLRSTDPLLPPRVISWLMTGVWEATANDSEKRREICALTAAAGQRTAEGRSSYSVKGNVVSGETLSDPSETSTVGWRMNIPAIHRMIASKQLRWHFTDTSVPIETGQSSRCREGGAPSSQSRKSGRNLRENSDGAGAITCSRPANNRLDAQKAARLQSHDGCGVYEGPTLFLKGSDSPYIDMKKHWDAILKVFPSAKCKVVSGAGHWLHADKPQVTAEYINEFLLSTLNS